MPLASGARLGAYEIIAPLGAGGMGEVWRARDPRLHREVAIKVLPPAFAADPDRLSRFTREAQVLASLNHPNIAAIYGIEEGAIVMELVEGATLAERIAQGPIPLDEAIPIARQIAEALEYAHERGTVHRDLKPANVKVTHEGVVKVLDFGLAKAMSSEAVAGDPAASPTLTMRATMAGTIIGTAGYMSPEQAKGKPVDRRADIWAFGCVLQEMLSGRAVFAGETISDILAAVIKEQPDLSSAPPHLRAVIERCLRKDARMRWQAIGDVRIALEEPKAADPEVAKAPPMRRSLLPWAAAGMAIAMAGGMAAVHFREAPARVEMVRFQVLPPEKASFGLAFSLSPDGRLLAFNATAENGRTYIWLRPLNSLQANAMPATEGATYLPFWSPDSRFLVFAVRGKLKKIEVAGGPAQVICDAPQVVIGGSWSAAGIILFSNNISVILKVPAAGGVATPLTRLEPRETYHSHPFFLPDGRHFLYSRLSSRAEDTGIYVGSVDAKPEEQRSRRVAAAQFAVYAAGRAPERGYLLFLRDRSLIAQPFDAGRLEAQGEAVPVADPVGQYVSRGLFSASATGTLAYQAGSGAMARLAWYDRQGHETGNAAEPGPYRSPRISPDGTRLAVRRLDPPTGNVDIWLIDLIRGGSTRFTFDPRVDILPVWSPDGSQVVFSSDRASGSDLYRKPSTLDRAEEVLLHTDETKAPSDWSPDGHYLIYGSENSKTGSDLWLLPNPGDAGPHTPVPFLQTEFRETQAQFSPDGRWVAYVSDSSSRPEVYVRPLQPSRDGAGQWMISNGGGVQPRWNRNGKELLYFNGRKLMSVEVTTAGGFRAGAAKVLFEAPIFGGGDIFSGHDWDVSPDGKKFLIVTEPTDHSATPITVVLNWMEGLGK